MFEITETTAMQNIEKTSCTIEALQSRGYTVAIDDFGTGYSSLGYLQRFKFDQIKIDGSFMSDLGSAGQRGGALLSAVVSLARALQIEVVAEGVETESQFRTLGELACDQAQGFLLAGVARRRVPPRSCVARRTGSSSPGAFAPRPQGEGGRARGPAVLSQQRPLFLDVVCIVCEFDTVAARRLGAIKCAIGPNDRIVNRLA